MEIHRAEFIARDKFRAPFSLLPRLSFVVSPKILCISSSCSFLHFFFVPFSFLTLHRFFHNFQAKTLFCARARFSTSLPAAHFFILRLLFHFFFLFFILSSKISMQEYNPLFFFCELTAIFSCSAPNVARKSSPCEFVINFYSNAPRLRVTTFILTRLSECWVHDHIFTQHRERSRLHKFSCIAADRVITCGCRYSPPPPPPSSSFFFLDLTYNNYALTGKNVAHALSRETKRHFRIRHICLFLHCSSSLPPFFLISPSSRADISFFISSWFLPSSFLSDFLFSSSLLSYSSKLSKPGYFSSLCTHIISLHFFTSSSLLLSLLTFSFPFPIFFIFLSFFLTHLFRFTCSSSSL